MSCSLVAWLLPLTLGLSLGLPTQGPQLFNAPPGPPRFLNKEQIQELWQKYQQQLASQAAKAQELALHYWNQKYNTTFYTAPGEMNHVTVETKVGQIFHSEMNLIQVSCPNNKIVNLQNCTPVPGSPKLACKLAVIAFVQHDKVYINEEGCQEARAPSAHQNYPGEINIPPYPEEKEGRGPYYA